MARWKIYTIKNGNHAGKYKISNFVKIRKTLRLEENNGKLSKLREKIISD